MRHEQNPADNQQSRMSERGAGLAEYGMLGLLIAVVCVVAISGLAPVINSMVNAASAALGN